MTVDIWPDATLEQQMLAECIQWSLAECIPANVAIHVKALLKRVRALEAQRDKLFDECLRLSNQTPEDVWLELVNAGAYSCAHALRRIAETGEQKGRFGGEVVQKAADAILAIWNRARALEARRD